MPSAFQVLAADYDGTLTNGATPGAAVLDAIAEARRDGRRVVLVTGRILAELRHAFAGVDDHFDAIVAENGAVLTGPAGHRRLAAPVAPALEDALTRRAVPVRAGEVLLACDAAHGVAVAEEIHRLGLDCQVMYNRAALMVLPAGVSKGTGLSEALADLAVSPHSAIGVGDAENDHALLEACELGVAVANAVPSLKERADVVLDEPDGAGVASLLRGPILSGQQRVHPRRWQVELGRHTDKTVAAVPASQVNVLVTGGSRAGKSYTGGLIAEQLILLGYSVLVIDVEGDHTGLGDLRDVLVFDASGLPGPDDVPRLLRHRFVSVVLDLSSMAPADQDAYVGEVAAAVRANRADCGLPHWIVVDEAHRPFSASVPIFSDTSRKGYCLITWQPGHLRPETIDDLDMVVALASPDGDDDQVTEFLTRWSPDDDLAGVLTRAEPGQALLSADPGRAPVLVDLAERRTGHVRHWHKYATAELPVAKRFYFRRSSDEPTGRVAANVREFHRILGHCGDDVIDHHTRNHDFSRWALHVLQDATLAASLSASEDTHVATGDPPATRRGLLRAIETRYIA